MKRLTWPVTLLFLLVPIVTVANGDPDEREAELYHTPAQKAEAGEWTMISGRIAFSGLVEVEIVWEDEDGEVTSDVLLSTAQLGFRGLVNEELSALLVADYDDEENVFAIDEATLDFERRPWYLRLGIQDITFGYFPSHFVSGPLTENLGEAKETAVLIGYAPEGLDISVWAANGEADQTGRDDRIDDVGLSIMTEPVEGLEIGISYTADLADTDAELTGLDYSKRVAGVSGFFALGIGDLEVTGEYLSAAEEFDRADLDGDTDGEGDTPSAWNGEIAWQLQEDLELAGRLGGSSEYTGEPETQFGLCLSYGVWEGVSLSIEYLHDEFDAAFSEEEKRDTVTSQLAVEF